MVEALASLDLKENGNGDGIVAEIKKRNNWEQLLEDASDFEILAEEFNIEKYSEKRRVRRLLMEEPEYKELQNWWKTEKKEAEAELE